MPANYAHYRFGKQLLPGMDAETARSIQRFRRLYDMGLHGPDFFFYYNPLIKTAAGELGHTCHAQSGQEFFANACARADTEAGRVYLYGLLAHYCLDSVCHPFIAKLDAAKTCGHSELETEFDRFLLCLDAEPLPHTRDLGEHLRLGPEELEVMARFFPPATAAQLKRCIRNMTWATRILSGRGMLPRGILERVIPVAGETVRQQLMPRQPDPRVSRFDEPLLGLYTQALDRFPGLAAQLESCLLHGTPLNADFDPIMG